MRPRRAGRSPGSTGYAAGVTSTLSEIQARTFGSATSATTTAFPPDRRLSDAQLRAYLGRRAYALVATGRPDGRPHTAMTLYVVSGTELWLPTVRGSVRERNVRRQPWASVVVTEGDDDEHVVVHLEGPAAVVGAEAAPPDVRRAVDAEWLAAWIQVRVDRVLSYAAPGARV